MKILYVCHQFFPSHYTGTERYTLEIAKQVQRMGHSVTVLTYSVEKIGTQLPGTKGVELRAYDFEGLPVFALAHEDFDDRGGWSGISMDPADPIIGLAMDRFLDQNTFDIVHCVHPMRLGAVAKSAHARGLKVVLTLMDFWLLCPRGTLLQVDGKLCHGPDGGQKCASHCYESSAAEELTRRYETAKELLNIADVIIAHSQFVIDVFRADGVDTAKFIHLRNGMDYSVTRSHRTSITAPKTRPTINIGFLGTLLPHKGVHVLIKAFRKVPEDNIRLKVFGGSFGMHDYYSHLLSLAEGDHRIEFCGEYQFENVSDVLRDIDLVVVPSVWYENAPLVISTAQMFGIPVIASRLGGMAEMVVNGINGFTFESGDVEGLAEIVRNIVSNPNCLRQLGRNAIPPPRVETEASLLESLYSRVTGEFCEVYIPKQLSPAQVFEGKDKVEIVHMSNLTDLFGRLDRREIRRVIDVGCHRGEHIANILSKQFPEAEIVGVEPKPDNYEECIKASNHRIKFIRKDCRSLSKEEMGTFDFVWCWGLIYHLDDPTLLMKALASIVHDRSWVCIDGHIAIEGDQAYAPYLEPTIVRRVFAGDTYDGKMFREFEENTSQSDKDKLDRASLDNPWSFWLTYESMLKLFRVHGFGNITEFRSQEPASPFGPGLFYRPVDPDREWSRRLFLISR